jgi:hypothetical protein
MLFGDSIPSFTTMDWRFNVGGRTRIKLVVVSVGVKERVTIVVVK